MDSITIRLQGETLATIENEADSRDSSKSDVIRDWFREREELQDECEELQTECERLQNEKRLIVEQREEHTELVEYVEEERSVRQRREERRDAPAWTRAKWWLVGRDRGES